MTNTEESTMRLLRAFNDHDNNFKNLMTELNYYILPRLEKIDKMDDYTLGRISSLVNAIKEPTDLFREGHVPDLKNNWININERTAVVLTGAVDMLIELTNELERCITILDDFREEHE